MNPAILSSRKAINGVPVPPVIPQRDAPLRSEAHAAVLRADVPGLLEEAEAFGEDDEDGQGPHGDKHENEHHKTGRTGKASPARTLARVRCVPPAPPRHSRSANSAHRAWAPSAHRCHPVLRSRADVHERLCDARSSRRRHLPSRVTSAGGRAVRRRTTSISVSSRACPWYAQMRGLEHPGAPLRRYDAVGMGISGALRMRWDAETPRSPSYTTLRSKRRSRCEQKQAMTTSGGAIDGGVQMRWGCSREWRATPAAGGRGRTAIRSCTSVLSFRYGGPYLACMFFTDGSSVPPLVVAYSSFVCVRLSPSATRPQRVFLPRSLPAPAPSGPRLMFLTFSRLYSLLVPYYTDTPSLFGSPRFVGAVKKIKGYFVISLCQTSLEDSPRYYFQIAAEEISFRVLNMGGYPKYSCRENNCNGNYGCQSFI